MSKIPSKYFYNPIGIKGFSKSIYHKNFSKAINVMNRNKMPKASVFKSSSPSYDQIHHNQMHSKIWKCMFMIFMF
jgi:hypothetical protein